MSDPKRDHRDERGVALVVAMLVLLVITLITVLLMSSISVETKVTGYGVRETKALDNAEAGVAEAVARIRKGDIPYDASNPRQVAVIFRQSAGSLPSVGTDTLALATGQPSGAWLDYSSPGKGPDMLTVSYKTDAAHTQIYRYDPTKSPAVNTSTGSPIFVINATGHRGSATKHVVAEVFANPIVLNTNAAVSTNNDIKLAGNGVVCGYDHVGATPIGTGVNGRTSSPRCDTWEVGGAATNYPGVRTTKTVKTSGGSSQAGNPTGYIQGQVGFYTGPWDVISMTQSQFYAWIGPATSTPPSPCNGLVYLDNDNIPQNASGSWTNPGSSGQGLLYVDGSLTLNSSFNYKGLIYCEGPITVNGQAWILGALVASGLTDGKLTGGMTVLYSSEAIQQALMAAGAQFVSLSWREI